MKQNDLSRLLRFSLAGVLLLMLAAPILVAEEPKPAAIKGWDAYISQVESRLANEHQSPESFLAPEDWARLKQGELIVEEVKPATSEDFPGALLHDWRGTAFVPGATAADFERLMQDFAAYPRIYPSQILRTKVVSHEGDHWVVNLRVRQKHMITVVMDMTQDITFGLLNAQCGYSLSHSTEIQEIDSPGTPQERALSPSEQHGYLWRLDNYWSYEERDGGLYIQIESISLSRSTPAGLGWAIGPFINGIPRESLEFTLHATRKALKK